MTLKKTRIYLLIGAISIITGIILSYVDGAILKTGWINPFLPIFLILIGIVFLFMSKPSPRFIPRSRLGLGLNFYLLAIRQNI